jgi:hypothetical protein
LTTLDVDGIESVPGYVPDPLFDEDSLFLPPNETHGFWLTLRPGKNTQPGDAVVKIVIHEGDAVLSEHPVDVRVHSLTLAPIRDFSVTNWFYADSLIDWYRTDLFDERFWEVFQNYAQNMVEHGQNVLYVPVFTPPLDGVKRPSQLLKVSREKKGYRFDWSDVQRYVRTAKKCGITHFEWCHPFTQWGAAKAIRVYEGQGRDETLLWPVETEATSAVYKTFLSQYLPQLKQFLTDEKIIKNSYFHVSDEPHGQEHVENYRKARELLRELAPWMTVMDALSDISYAREKLTDMPIPVISKVIDFVNEGIPCWCYYCCGPRGKFLNRLLDTPLPKIAMHGFLFYRWPFKGFLHWGYNYWYESQTRNLIDPFTVQDGKRWEKGWAYGDTFLVYPGPDGPIDSIRWEVFSESLQDYSMLQTLGIARDDKMLSALKSFDDFPKTEKWRNSCREKCFEMGK